MPSFVAGPSRLRESNGRRSPSPCRDGAAAMSPVRCSGSDPRQRRGGARDRPGRPAPADRPSPSEGQASFESVSGQFCSGEEGQNCADLARKHIAIGQDERGPFSARGFASCRGASAEGHRCERCDDREAGRRRTTSRLLSNCGAVTCKPSKKIAKTVHAFRSRAWQTRCTAMTAILMAPHPVAPAQKCSLEISASLPPTTAPGNYATMGIETCLCATPAPAIAAIS